MDRSTYLDAVVRDGAALAVAARIDLEPPVEHCPGWTVQSVVEHVGTIHRWVEEMVRTRASERLRRQDMAPPPTEAVSLIEWFEEGVERLVDTLGSVSPDEPVWNWSLRPHVAGFWPRRMAHETAIHRWDGERGAGCEQPIDSALAVDGIEEVFDTIAPRMVSDSAPLTLGGTLHLHCTDREGEWLVSSSESGALDVRHEHVKGDCAVRGTASDLLLLLLNRPTRDRCEVFGDDAVLDAWSKLTF